LIARPLEIALEELKAGVKELPDPAEHPRIGEYLGVVGLGPDDETSWCSGFAAYCVKQAGYSIEGITGAARSWFSGGWGVPAPAEPGVIAVLWRGEPRGWQGHVGFLLDVNPDELFLLGGNQGNRVSVQRFAHSRLLGYRQPRGGW
jgi:uncharacterized protein (TIGR02594 family)